MSSHREAPEISKDPTADSTDVYAFVTPGDATTVTLIANYIPLQAPDGGPNFYEFDDKVGYFINRPHGEWDGGHLLRVPVHHRQHQPHHLSLQQRSDRQGHRRHVEPQADLQAVTHRPQHRDHHRPR